MESFNFYRGKKFEQPIIREEIEAARIAAAKVLEEAKKKEEAERPQKEREEQAKIRIKAQAMEEVPVYQITEKDAKEAEDLIKNL